MLVFMFLLGIPIGIGIGGRIWVCHMEDVQVGTFGGGVRDGGGDWGRFWVGCIFTAGWVGFISRLGFRFRIGFRFGLRFGSVFSIGFGFRFRFGFGFGFGSGFVTFDEG